MDARLETLAAAQAAAGFTGLSGSEAHGTIRISDEILSQAIGAVLPPGGAVHALTVHAKDGNLFDVTVALRNGLVPSLRVQLAIARQPALPADPVLVLRLVSGGALLTFAGPLLARALPEGVRLQDDCVHVDLRALLAARGQAAAVALLTALRITTAASVVAMEFSLSVPSSPP